MAFGVEELRVLRRALALALHPRTASAEDVQDCLRLADSLDEAMCEGARLRAFLVADLARYRDALPGTAAGYLTLLEEALGAGYRPAPDDLAALRALRGNPIAAALLDRCQKLAEQDVRARLARGTARRATPAVPASRTRLLALPGGLSAAPGDSEGDAGKESGRGSGGEPDRKPGRGSRESDSERRPGEHNETWHEARPGAPGEVRSEAFGVRAGEVRVGGFAEVSGGARVAGLTEVSGGARVGVRGEASAEQPEKPVAPVKKKPAEKPGPAPAAPKPGRPIPTPGEVFPRRKPAPPPPASPPQQLAAG
ncbi:MAG: hypothetical protein HOV73_14920 [Streptomyces sp.]|nr:hypothetical protein [Streptomyces sp.]NUR41368.1 hypothetical protein [Streptomyces sp.]NUS24931.1 hypothetical protein [Streptomyces sp.]